MNKHRAELHLHTTMSAMDGVSTVTDYIKAAIFDKLPAIAITDHASVHTFPDAYRTMKRNNEMDLNLKLIYGNEIYMVDDRPKAVKGFSNSRFDDEFTVVDIETTGLNSSVDKITEIAAYKIKKGIVSDNYVTLVNPKIFISEEIENLTGITNEMVKNAPEIDVAIREFCNFCDGSIIVAHNAVFDLSFLKKNACEYGIEFNPVFIDTVTLSRSLLAGLRNYKLDTVCEELSVEFSTHHRAYSDAKATADMFIKLCEKLCSIGIDSVNKINDIIEVSYKGMSFHASILVANKKGLKNLYKLVSLANTEYFYKVPRTPKSELEKYREGLLIGSGCDSGELYHAVRDGVTDDELVEIAMFYDYLEVVPIGNFDYYIECGYATDKESLIAINTKIVKIGELTGKPVVAVSDAHYVHEDDQICRKIIKHHQGYTDYNNQPLLSMRTTDEMLAEFDYLDEEKACEIVIENTNKIADMVDDLFPPIDTEVNYEADIKELVDLTYKKLHEKYGEDVPQEMLNRIDWELSIIGQNQRNIYNILISSKLVGRAVEKGWKVGSRGSVASSYIAYLLGITEINPLEAHYYCPSCHCVEFHKEYNCGVDMDDKVCKCGTKFEKEGFTIPHETFFGIDGSRDIDMGFNFDPQYQEEAFDHLKELTGGKTIHCGTVSTISEKYACNMMSQYCKKEDIKFDKYLKDEIADKLSKVKRTTGMYPGGVLVIPKEKDIYDYTPVQYPAHYTESEIQITHFDYYLLTDLVKLNVLGHDMPSLLRQLEELTGVESRLIPLDDKETMTLIRECDTTGIQEFSEQCARDTIKLLKPKTFDDLIRVSAISRGTNVFEEAATRDDVMLKLVECGIDREYAFKLSERIRKGKGFTCEQYDELAERGVSISFLDSCNDVMYSFPKAHCVEYTKLAFSGAYYKTHYPLEFYCVFLNMCANEFEAEMLDCNYLSKIGKKPDEDKWKFDYEQTVAELCSEILERGYEFVLEKEKTTVTGFSIENGKLKICYCKD